MKKVLLIIGVIAVLCGAGWLVNVLTTVQVKARNSKLSADLESLFDGLQTYKENVGTYPVGGNADIAKALTGINPKKVIIRVGRKLDQNNKGEFVDPWGTPLRFYFADNSILIRSAGPNGRFEESSAMAFDDFIRSN
jgi:type II secretory pathway pseudopilin PulG